MILEGAAAIILVHLGGSFVLLHDVENIAQHFVRDDIGFRAHGCGARVEIHAGHFAEEIAGAELGDRVAVGEIDGGVDRNDAVARFPAFIFFAPNQRTFQFFEKAECAAFVFT